MRKDHTGRARTHAHEEHRSGHVVVVDDVEEAVSKDVLFVASAVELGGRGVGVPEINDEGVRERVLGECVRA